jgi:hypothetical protein
MENRNWIIILSNFQGNTFEIVSSSIGVFELPKEIHMHK